MLPKDDFVYLLRWRNCDTSFHFNFHVIAMYKHDIVLAYESYNTSISIYDNLMTYLT